MTEAEVTREPATVLPVFSLPLANNSTLRRRNKIKAGTKKLPPPPKSARSAIQRRPDRASAHPSGTKKLPPPPKSARLAIRRQNGASAHSGAKKLPVLPYLKSGHTGSIFGAGKPLLILSSSLISSRDFTDFLRTVAQKKLTNNVHVITAGNLLPFLPAKSNRDGICFKLYPQVCTETLQKSADNQGKYGALGLIPIIKETTTPTGRTIHVAHQLACDFYTNFFADISAALNTNSKVHYSFIDGLYDYTLATSVSSLPFILQDQNQFAKLDYNEEVLRISSTQEPPNIKKSTLLVGGIGGDNVLGRGKDFLWRGKLAAEGELTMYGLNCYDESEYARRLECLAGVDVLVTATTPHHSPSLSEVPLFFSFLFPSFIKSVKFHHVVHVQHSGKIGYMRSGLDLPGSGGAIYDR
eukprot:TRINITY_DN337_c0_g1_i1.p1 TRINITY_DN337_c0_g1~~TRINITY_DN337_c0_g1_i1.p1  ORF type:complete len:411 (+),score=61.19 TRINITY_DN337_c0_g1_i1:181-1413(+)